MEFHVSRTARDRYAFPDALFSLTGTAIVADAVAARTFAQKLSADRPQPVSPGDIHAMGLIDEINHLLVAEYQKQVNPGAVARALAAVSGALGKPAVDAALLRFAHDFPTVDVYRLKRGAPAWLDDTTSGRPNREVALEEMLMLWVNNINPAFARYGELFADDGLKRDTAYQPIIDALIAFFDAQPPFLEGVTLIALLRAPALAHPDSLEAQLAYIESRWLGALPELRNFMIRLLTSRDLIREEERSLAQYFGAGFFGYGKPGYSEGEIRSAIRATYATDPEYEAYTQDRAWMPRLVLLAKNAYVWLDQLSKKYRRDIAKLDQVPDEELDMLARQGFTGIWLIGLWERSRASQRIKQMMGAHDAVASAYSLMGYRIADDLGGHAAMHDLRVRAGQRGLRMGSDMVPNHFGIDSDWVINRPDYFLSVDYPPYPGYTFNGPDLSDDPRVGVFIEDHYYTKSDAAVVFKRLDKHTGDVKYIYHGNDGTSMPWNDTAQLNYLRGDVREAIIQTILDVARNFPIIRFDAAMTLAKRHVQRLWFPIPGSGDGIPSRAGMGMTKEEFDRLVPQEFWREVVDRAAVEAPDTLLLAEAFWMLEGYFVRTLGMHRVYNSAFMHMMRDEDNAKYRYLIKETLEFDPQILKRYVNFMNNPDEKTAVEQFGKGDKYFGVALMMSTLPGLPMYGHGQIEGYAEKYGMEFRRPKLDEWPDQGLIDHHARVVFPILHKRYLFAEVDNFFLYDFYSVDGGVDENVFAYSNQFGEERALFVYHNKHGNTRGHIRGSAGFLVKGEGLRTTTLGAAFGLHNDGRHFLRFRDHVSGLEYLRPSSELNTRGVYVELGAYQCHVFLDIREVYDHDGSLARLSAELNGAGVPSIDERLREYVNASILAPTRALINSDMLRRLHDALGSPDDALLARIEAAALPVLEEAKRLSGGDGDPVALASAASHDVADALRLPLFNKRFKTRLVLPFGDADDATAWAPLFVWALINRVGAIDTQPGAGQRVLAWLDSWALRKPLLEAFGGLGMDTGAVHRALATVRAMLARDGRLTDAGLSKPKADEPRLVLFTLMQDPEVRRLTHVNAWQGETFFNKEAFESLIGHLLASELVLVADDRTTKAVSASAAAGKRAAAMAKAHIAQAATDGYRVLPPPAVAAKTAAKPRTAAKPKPKTVSAPKKPAAGKKPARTGKSTPVKAKPAKAKAKPETGG
jgi:hypothetical protein